MKLILFNTCGAEASFALADTTREAPLVAVATVPGRTASENLIAEVRRTMAQAHWKPVDLDTVVVVTGPGSFTGVRVGLGAAKGLAEATAAPVIAISRLALLAAAAGPQFRRVCALLDAGRGEFYCGEFASDTEARETLLSREEALNTALLTDATLVCEQPVFDALSGSIAIILVQEPAAADALPLALIRIEAGLFDDPLTLDASYLRRTDAEIFAKGSGSRP